MGLRVMNCESSNKPGIHNEAFGGISRISKKVKKKGKKKIKKGKKKKGKKREKKMHRRVTFIHSVLAIIAKALVRFMLNI